MSSIDNKLEMYIGNHEDFEIEITDEDDVVVDITDAEVIFSLKDDFSDEDYLFQRSNEDAGGDSTEVEMTDPTNGKCEVHIIPTNTQSLTKGTYVYDVWIKLTNGKEKTIIVNRLFLEDNVKRPVV